MWEGGLLTRGAGPATRSILPSLRVPEVCCLGRAGVRKSLQPGAQGGPVQAFPHSFVRLWPPHTSPRPPSIQTCGKHAVPGQHAWSRYANRAPRTVMLSSLHPLSPVGLKLPCGQGLPMLASQDPNRVSR